MEKKHVVIIGCGFAGINLAKALKKIDRFQITLVDKNNYNFFPPFIYQVATSMLEQSSISYPFRRLVEEPHGNFRLATVHCVQPENNKVILSNGIPPYDYLVFATGAVSNYCGNITIQRNAIPMKTLSDAISMRNRLLTQLESASISTNADDEKKALTIVIAGGGATGVEVAGMLAEMRKGKMGQEYAHINLAESEIFLVDGGKVLLAAMSPASQKDALNFLEKLVVKVLLNCVVKDFTNEEVMLSTGVIIQTKTLIWAAGITAQRFDGIAPEAFGRGN